METSIEEYSSVKMLYRIVAITLFLLTSISHFGVSAGRAFAQDTIRIVAIVNDEVVSMYDLEARIDLAIAASQLEESMRLRRQLAPQVLRSLVDERLQLQEANRLGVRVDETELVDAMSILEKRNKVPAGRLDEFLRSQGLEKSTVIEQIRGDILWSKVVGRNVRASIAVGEDEVDEALARLENNRGLSEYRVSEIFLAAGSSNEESEMGEAADRLYEQLVKGARFDEIARQFSQSATAAVGGDIGWVVHGQLPPELEAAVTELIPGAISRPVKAFDGYYILSLRDRRVVLSSDPLKEKVRLAQLVVTRSQMEELVNNGNGERLRNEIRSCEALLARAKNLGSELSGDLGEVVMGDLPANVRGIVSELEVGSLAAPMPYEGGMRFLMVCSRDKDQTGMLRRNAIRQDIAGRRLEMLARRYLRDLRRAAFVDIRL